MKLDTSRERMTVAGVLVGLLLVSAAAPAVAVEYEEVIGSPNLQVYAPNNTLSAGERTQLQVTVANDGEVIKNGPSQFTDRVTTARATSIEVSAGDAPVDVDTGRIPVGAVTTEQPSGPYAVSLTVNESAEPGTSRLPVTVRYDYTRAVDYTETQQGPTDVSYTDFDAEVTRYVTVRIDDSAQFRIVDVSSAAQVGDTGPVRLTLQNTGNEDASDATVTLRSLSGEITFGQSASSSRHVGAWPAGENRTVTYRGTVASDATAEQYALQANVSYNDPSGQSQHSNALSTGVTPDPKQSFRLANTESTLRVGTEGSVSGVVRNEGPRPVDNAVVVLETNSQNVHPAETEYALGSLDPGQEKRFSFAVEVSDGADAGPQQLSYVVRYDDEDGDSRQSGTLNTRAEVAERRSKFAVEPTDATVESGGSSLVTVEVTNNGDQPYRNVEAKAFADSPLSLADDTAFVTALDPGESTEMTFEVSAASTALNKTYALSMDFQYEDREGETKLSESYSVPVDVETSDGGGLPLTVLAGVVVVGVGAVGSYVWYRR